MALFGFGKSPRKWFEEGYRYYKSELYGKAKECFMKAASEDEPESLFYLGSMYLYGLGVEEDAEKGLSYLERSANLGLPAAKEVYPIYDYYKRERAFEAREYFFGEKGRKKDPKKAMEIIEIGVGLDDDQSYLLKGIFLIVGAEPIVHQNIDEGIQLILKVAKRGDLESTFILKNMFKNGEPYEGVPFEKNLDTYGKYSLEIVDAMLENGVEIGYNQAPIISNAVESCIYGYGTKVDKKRAKYYLDSLPTNIANVPWVKEYYEMIK